MTPKMPPTATVRMARPSPAICSNRRRFGAVSVSSFAAVHTSASPSVTASSKSASGKSSDGAMAWRAPASGKSSGGATAWRTSACDKTSGGAPASSTSAVGGSAFAATGAEGTAGSVGAAPFVFGAVKGAAAPAFGCTARGVPSIRVLWRNLDSAGISRWGFSSMRGQMVCRSTSIPALHHLAVAVIRSGAC